MAVKPLGGALGVVMGKAQLTRAKAAAPPRRAQGSHADGAGVARLAPEGSGPGERIQAVQFVRALAAAMDWQPQLGDRSGLQRGLACVAERGGA